MRIGLNSGPVIVGSIGDDLRMDYTAVGDTSNLASRIENIARPGTSLVSRHTHRLARDYFEFEALGKMEVKGKKEPQEIFELIKTGEVDTRIAASEAKGLTRFVGRKNSMAALMEAYEKVQSGSGQIVGVVGEAGVGKSRLLLEFKNRLSKGKFTYLEGRCLEYGGAMAYLPILDILRCYFEIKEGDREFLIKKKLDEKIFELDEKLKALLPSFHEFFSLKVEDQVQQKLEPQQKREKTFEALRDLLVRESQNRPIIIVVEDLHWIDKTSEEFLSYLIEWLANAHILLILLYRPEYTHTWGSKSYYSKIGLDQLTTQTSAALIQSILEKGEVVPELRELILSRAAGNPLFMEEFTHTLLENGSIQKKDHQYVLSTKASDIQVPDTIQGIIAARMDRLEDNLKRTMQVASVIGKDFAFRILQTITGMREGLKSYLLNLQGLEFIYEKSLFPELEYVFKHALTQEVAYNSLLQKRRTEIHAKIGQATEELYPERLEEFYEMLAYHYSKSENPERAYQYLKLSGNKAAKNYSNWEAFRHYKEAINTLTKMPVTEENKREQIEVRFLMAHPMILLGFPQDSLEILQKGEMLSNEHRDERSLAHFLSLIGQYYVFKGEDLLLGIKYSEESFKEAEKIDDVELMAPVGADLCLLYWWSGEYSKIVDLASKVIALLDKTHRQSEFFKRPYNIYSMLLANYGASMCMLGNFEEGIVLFEKGIDFALKIKDLFSLSLLETHYGWMQSLRGDAKNGIEHFQNSIRYCEEGQLVGIVTPAWIGLGWAYSLLGELETARKHIEKGLKIHSDVGLDFHLSLFYWCLGAVYLESGDLKNAQHWAEKALKISQKNHEKTPEGGVWILLGRIFGKAGMAQVNKAEECILQGIKILDELKSKPFYAYGYLFLGELYANTGQKDKALEHLKKAEGMFQEMGMGYWLAKAQDVLATL
jgi:tetratricopeptide (TPR) repeat protein